MPNLWWILASLGGNLFLKKSLNSTQSFRYIPLSYGPNLCTLDSPFSLSQGRVFTMARENDMPQLRIDYPHESEPIPRIYIHAAPAAPERLAPPYANALEGYINAKQSRDIYMQRKQKRSIRMPRANGSSPRVRCYIKPTRPFLAHACCGNSAR